MHRIGCLSHWLGGMAVTFGVYVAGHFGSQGHLNPAVTIGFAVFGFFPWNAVFPYLLGQFLGAFIGAVIVIIQYYPHFKATKTAADGNMVGIFATAPAIKNPTFNFLSEVIATCAFIFTLLNLGDFTQGLKPVIVGLLITVVGQALGGAQPVLRLILHVTGHLVLPIQFCLYQIKPILTGRMPGYLFSDRL